MNMFTMLYVEKPKFE